MPNISFIIPTYNSLSLLKRCLCSIYKQIDEEDEIIIINDGSNDGTKKFLSEYCKNKSNVFFINQKNLGSGPARNAGLAKSSKEYIWFIDADDYIQNDAVKLVKDHLNKYHNDLLFISYVTLTNNNTKVNRLEFNPNNINEVLLTQHYPWNKIIKRTLFQGIEFPNEKIRYQDVATIPRITLKAKKIGILKDTIYYYDFSHSQNITKNITKEKDIFIACDYLVKNLIKNNYHQLEIILFHLLVFNRIYFAPKISLKFIHGQVKSIKNYLDERLPKWRKSPCLKMDFAKKYNKFIPFLNIKILIGKILRYSTWLTSLIVFFICLIKPLARKI